MSGSELSVECELRNGKNQAAYLLADNCPTKSRKGFLSFRNLQIHLNKLAQQVNLTSLYISFSKHIVLFLSGKCLESPHCFETGIRQSPASIESLLLNQCPGLLYLS